MEKTNNKGNTGPLVASIIIIIVLLISAFYALKERPLKTENEPVIDDIKVLETQSTSTEMTDIEADLNATNLDNLGLDMGAAEAEL